LENETNQILVLGLCLFVIPTLGWLISAAFAIGEESHLVMEMVIAGYALGALIFLTIIGSPLIAGTDRARMSLIFGPSVRFVMVLLAGSVLVQAGLLIYSLFTLEASTIGRVHVGIMLGLGLGALAVCYALIRSAFGLFAIDPMAIRAVPSNHATLRDRVNSLADHLGAERPDNIAIGLEPNFFVTSAPVNLVGNEQQLQGTTLFVSLSLMRILTDDEFNAVIGHELGHFRGSDTVYSLKFAPTYSRLSHALAVLSQGSESAGDIVRIPALAALSAHLTRFAKSERTVGRQRELLADQAGVSVAHPKALATALLKVAIFSQNWTWLTHQHISELAEGRTYTRLGTTFRDVSALADDVNWNELRSSVGAAVQAHPVDTHPTFSERIIGMGLSVDQLEAADCAHPELPAVHLVEDADEIDADLSDLEANWLIAIGAAQLPQAT
jgi:Zn-dependent protease with chaperone function